MKKLNLKKIAKFDNVALGAILNDKRICREISDIWHKDLFYGYENKGQLIEWAVKYYNENMNAPGPSEIQYFKNEWAEEITDESIVNNMDEDHKQMQKGWEISSKKDDKDFICKILNSIIAHAHHMRLEDLTNGNHRKFHKLLQENPYPLEIVLQEEDWKENHWEFFETLSTVDQKTRTILKFGEAVGDDGSLNEFFSTAVIENCFIAIQAPEKSAKSYILNEFAMRAIEQKKKVAYFQCGDLMPVEVYERIYQRIFNHPINKGVDTISVPHGISQTEDGWEANRDEGVEVESFSKKKAKKRWAKLKVDDLLRLEFYATSSLSADMIDDKLQGWKAGGWKPDLIVIDYADILAAPRGYSQSGETREMINLTWKYLRRISMNHAGVITATQANAASYSQETLTKANFSEDKRKYSHVTGTLGLSFSDRLKERGLLKLNWIQLRNLPFTANNHLLCAHCLDVSKPFVKTQFIQQGRE